MLQTIRQLHRTPLRAVDGEIGRCKDFLFDDRHWTVRYMVADTGKWIPGRKVLISPISLGPVGPEADHVSLNLTRDAVERAPALAEDAPVSRQYEMAFHQHYGYAYYWEGAGAWGGEPTPKPLRYEALPDPDAFVNALDGDPHLRSAREVMGYRIDATDGHIGHIEDFLVDDESWTLRYVLVDTRNWLPGRTVIFNVHWMTDVNWTRRHAGVDLSKAQIERSPEYRDEAPFDHNYEKRLHEFYGRPAYWDVRGA